MARSDFSSKSIEEINQLLILLEGHKDYSELELIGKTLSAQQFLQILELFSEKHIPIDKLSALLVGLPPSLFYEALYLAKRTHLKALKQEGILEPLEHQLNVFSNECDNKLALYQSESIQIENEIHQIKINTLTSSDLRAFHHRIHALSDKYYSFLQTIDKALAVTWNTNRIDLIEKLSHLKERTHMQFIRTIDSSSENNRSSGLLKELEQALSKVYESEEIRENDQAIEGLACLSIWYLKDYWEIGLLPQIQEAKELELEVKSHDRQQLFDQVHCNLMRLGIQTIEDLKKAQIFSKNMLKEYIQQHKDLLL